MTAPDVVDLRALDAPDLPLALARARKSLDVGDPVRVLLAEDQPGRGATAVEAAAVDVASVERGDGPGGTVEVRGRAVLGLPDHVGPGMRLLSVGLNPSLHSATAGIGYVQHSNRYWKAMLAAGLATVDRDPEHLLVHHGIGMTDLVKRPTPRAAEVSAAEFAEGIARLEALVDWLRPGAIAIVGLQGWRAGRDRKAVAGWQPGDLAGVPVYVLPSTSGLNATTSVDQLAEHLRTAATGR